MKHVSLKLIALLLLLSEAAALANGKDLRPTYRVGVDTVVVRVTVTDPLERHVVGLEREHFRIFENKIGQEITHFSADHSPISVGLIVDMSGSMEDNLASARKSVERSVEGGNPEDEYFLVLFNDRVTLAHGFTSRIQEVQNRVAMSKTKGRTALYDAVYLGVEKMREARHDKRALIVITDGEDNSSRYTYSELRGFVEESDVQIYVIGQRGELRYGRQIIAEISSLTGGRAFFARTLLQLDYFVDLIYTELRSQYLLGYMPSDRNYQGRWRKIKVKLDPPEGLPKLVVRAKKGYLEPGR